jgi:transcriptional regulator with XRE-family HTH domain
MNFHEWLNKKYVDWRGNAVGQERSITEFANMIGVSQSLMTQWMQQGGKKPRTQATINKLVSAFGVEVYEVLGFQPPDHLLEIPPDLPPEVRQELLSAQRQFIQEWLENHGHKRIR